MKKGIKTLKQEALSSLQGRWVEYILLTILGGVIYNNVAVVAFFLLFIPFLFVTAVYNYVIGSHLPLRTLDGYKLQVEDLFKFDGKIWNIFRAFMLLVLIFLLASIPMTGMGIWIGIKDQATNGEILTFVLVILLSIIYYIYLSVRYSLVFLLLRDTDLSATECLRESSNLTKNNIWRIVFFNLSFIGWILLIPLTFGLISLWLSPYMAVAKANLYRTIALEKGFHIDIEKASDSTLESVNDTRIEQKPE